MCVCVCVCVCVDIIVFANSRGKGRQVLQFGAYYDYASHRIEPEIEVEKMSKVLEKLVDRLISQRALPQSVRPDTAIINVYRPGDNIPPHIDHMDYPRPFSTLSLLSDAEMLLGARIEPRGKGSFSAPCTVNLPRRSLLVLDGNGANIAKVHIIHFTTPFKTAIDLEVCVCACTAPCGL